MGTLHDGKRIPVGQQLSSLESKKFKSKDVRFLVVATNGILEQRVDNESETDIGVSGFENILVSALEKNEEPTSATLRQSLLSEIDIAISSKALNDDDKLLLVIDVEHLLAQLRGHAAANGKRGS